MSILIKGMEMPKNGDVLKVVVYRGQTYIRNTNTKAFAGQAVEIPPHGEQEVKQIGYQECADAMLKMWMDDILTDGEYNKIMDKLNATVIAEVE